MSRRELEVQNVDLQVNILCNGSLAVRELIQEHLDLWSDSIETFVRRQFFLVPLSLALEHPIQEFPLTLTGDREWYQSDLQETISILPTAVEPPGATVVSRATLVQNVDVQFLFANLEDNENDGDLITIADTCMTLSCLLQLAPAMNGSPYHLFALRRLILPVLLEDIVDNACLEFDVSHLEMTMQEWLTMPVGPSFREVETAADRITDSHGMYLGRTRGCIFVGARSVGKSYFCHEIINSMIRVCPWMVQVVYFSASSSGPTSPVTHDRHRHHSFGASKKVADGVDCTVPFFSSANVEPPTQSHIATQNYDDREYFDAAQFLGVSGSIGGPAVTANSVKVSIQSFFHAVQRASRPGKIVVTFIDNIDLLAATSSSQQPLNEFLLEIFRTESEFFLLGTACTMSIPTFDCIESAREEQIWPHFRTIKVFDLSLEAAYSTIVKKVMDVDSSSLCSSTLERVRHVAQLEMESPTNKFRKELELQLHGIQIAELNQLAMELCIRLGNVLEMGDTAMSARTFKLALADIIRERRMTTSNECYEWLKPLHPQDDHIAHVAKLILKSTLEHDQHIHFVQLVAEYDAPETLIMKESNRPIYCHKIPFTSAHLLLRALHEMFRFRSSILLKAPGQLVPHDPFHSSINPQSNANPFNDYIWHHRHSLVVIDDLDTLVGFHSSPMYQKGKRVGASNNDSQSTSYGRSLGRTVNGGAGVVSLIGQAFIESVAANEGLVTGNSAGGNLDFKLSMGGPAMAAGANRDWSTVRSSGKGLTRSEGHLNGFIPQASIGYSRSYGISAGRSDSYGTGSNEGEDDRRAIAYRFVHYEALSKVIRGFQIVNEISVRDVEELRNLVVCFFKDTECLREIIHDKLAWAADTSFSMPRVGCDHRACRMRFLAPCCGQWYNCQKCHDEENPDHELERSRIEAVQCLYCLEQQPLSRPTCRIEVTNEEDAIHSATDSGCQPEFFECQTCHRAMAKGCKTCRVWWHSRKPQESVHCKRCQRCFDNHYFKYHQVVCQE